MLEYEMLKWSNTCGLVKAFPKLGVKNPKNESHKNSGNGEGIEGVIENLKEIDSFYLGKRKFEIRTWNTKKHLWSLNFNLKSFLFSFLSYFTYSKPNEGGPAQKVKIK